MKNQYSEEEKKLAAYALNMCTVSVSQIVDYNDIYVLEQEYEAILNNLNLEKFPKTDALYNVLVEILNTVTFFRIQELRKEQIEKRYQKKIKNAIWSSMNTITVLATGNVWAMAYAAITQIGIGYIDYRRKKNEINNNREKDELELRITAMEQFHALQRELFTTAWKMAEEYGFLDQYRITERQLKQYNEILLDEDPKRRYDRLEEIRDDFEAYPQFWYFLGHAAYEAIRESEEDEVREFYYNASKTNYKKFIEFQDMGLLREDQIVASCALEYVDLLDQKNDAEMIIKLLDIAISNAGTMNDIRQICAIGYLKVNSEISKQKAINQLLHLVNCGYNSTVNAQLLSYLLVGQIVNEESNIDYYKVKYLTLNERVRPEFLYRLPDSDLSRESIDSEFCKRQKEILRIKYTLVLRELIRKYQISFNKIIPRPYADREYPDAFFEDSTIARKDRENEVDIISKLPRRWNDFCRDLDIVGIKYEYLLLLNNLLISIGNMEIVSEEVNEELKGKISNSIKSSTREFDRLYDRINQQDDPFNFADYKALHDITFRYFTEEFFKLLKSEIRKQIELVDSIVIITKLESDLDDLCESEDLASPDYLYEHKDDRVVEKESELVLSADLFGEDVKIAETKNRKSNTMCEVIEQYADVLITNHDKVVIYYGRDARTYDKYFSQGYLCDFNKKLKKEALMIIDDKSITRNYDLMLTASGIVPIYKGQAKSSVSYIDVVWDHGKQLAIGKYPYENKGVDLTKLKELFDKLAEI